VPRELITSVDSLISPETKRSNGKIIIISKEKFRMKSQWATEVQWTTIGPPLGKLSYKKISIIRNNYIITLNFYFLILSNWK